MLHCTDSASEPMFFHRSLASPNPERAGSGLTHDSSTWRASSLLLLTVEDHKEVSYVSLVL